MRRRRCGRRRRRFVVVAAGLADPGNLGTILRIGRGRGRRRRRADAEGSVDVVQPQGRAGVGGRAVPRAGGGRRRRRATCAASACRCWRPRRTGGCPTRGGPRPAAGAGARERGPRVPSDVPVDGALTIPHAGRAESLNVAMAAPCWLRVARRLAAEPEPAGRLLGRMSCRVSRSVGRWPECRWPALAERRLRARWCRRRQCSAGTATARCGSGARGAGPTRRSSSPSTEFRCPRASRSGIRLAGVRA